MDKDHIQNNYFAALDNFSGPLKERVRTDKKFTWFFITLFGLYLIHVYASFTRGNPKRLYYGLDFRSEPCGDGNLTKRTMLYWPYPNVDSNVTMCVPGCPNFTVSISFKKLWFRETKSACTILTECHSIRQETSASQPYKQCRLAVGVFQWSQRQSAL